MSVPRATMRLQLHRGFTFADATALVPYLAALGVSHLYASPIMTARPGSPHGYDVIDPTRVNGELGGEEALRRLVEALRQHEMGLIVDTVPNHMAVGSNNPWWMHVLARGEASRYAKFFDINWEPPDPQLRGKVLLPILGRPYGEAVRAGEITLDGRGDHATVRYFDHAFPVAAGSATAEDLARGLAPGSPDRCERLHDILQAQHYRLAWWRAANDEINWRRFFDINELAALRVEDDEVFDTTHATLFRLYAEGLIDGVRVDHIDGLADPETYCRKLRERLAALEPRRPGFCPGGPAYLVVEKILAADERLPQEWQTDGTTGYDFMDDVSALQHDPRGEACLRDAWERISGRPGEFAVEAELARRQILQRSFSAQLEADVAALSGVAQSDLATRDYAPAALRRALTEILAHFPVYRIYARPGICSGADRDFLVRALEGARRTALPSDAWLVDVLGDWLGGAGAGPPALQTVALARFEQLSAPLCAKAVEDTAFYRYGRLLSRNDVGFDPGRFSCSPAEFHARMSDRAANLPRSLLATATHDHKRGEDVRARLAVLSEVPDEWAAACERWKGLSDGGCAVASGAAAPDAADRAMLFQMVLGAWPFGLELTDRDGLARYAQRIAGWQQKALREAKLHTDWSAPNEDYERAASDFVAWVFSGHSDLLAELAQVAARIAPAGAANGLAQVLLRLTAPGVPDTYQGTEYWDLSLVDPDNRAPVDFAERRRSLDASLPGERSRDWSDGRIKQSLIACVLALRRKMPALFAEGRYISLQVEGPLGDHIVAFARLLDDQAAIIAASRFPFRLLAGDGSLTIPAGRWAGTRIVLPPELSARSYSPALSPDAPIQTGQQIAAEQILTSLPIAVLTACGK